MNPQNTPTNNNQGFGGAQPGGGFAPTFQQNYSDNFSQNVDSGAAPAFQQAQQSSSNPYLAPDAAAPSDQPQIPIDYHQLPQNYQALPNAIPPTQVPTQPFANQQQQSNQPVQTINTNTQTTPDHPLATQTMLEISELRDNLVIMKDGSFRAVVACQSINFDLMSNAEREAIEYSYQNFLNSLTFTTQILIRNQRIDIGPYIEYLSDLRRNMDNMLLGVLMDDYINFIDILSQEANIMDTSFFVVVPYYSSPDLEKSVQETKNFMKTFTRAKNPPVTRIERATYEKAITEINNRVDTIVAGLNQIGVRSVRLNTRKLGELFYNFNNPDTAIREPLVDFNKLATIYVKRGA